MRSLGISILALFYCGAGGVLGEFIHAVFQGRAPQWFKDEKGFLIGVFVGNTIAIVCLLLLRPASTRQAPMQSTPRPLELFAHGLPVTNRIAFLLFSVAWVVGLVLGIAFSI